MLPQTIQNTVQNTQPPTPSLQAVTIISPSTSGDLRGAVEYVEQICITCTEAKTDSVDSFANA